MQHCARCFQHECTRSQYGKSKFEIRVNSWEDRLFKKTPRMDEADPRFEIIRSKKFVEIDPRPAPEVGQGAWVDPRDLDDNPKAKALAEFDAVARDVGELETTVLATSEPKLDDPAPEPKPQKAVAPMNTPNRPGQMVGGREKPEAKPAQADPWEPKKEPAPSKEQVVKPGARIRFGGSGV